MVVDGLVDDNQRMDVITLFFSIYRTLLLYSKQKFCGTYTTYVQRPWAIVFNDALSGIYVHIPTILYD